MDDATAGPRIRDLRQRLAQLQARHADLTAQAANQPAPPPPATIARIRDHVGKIMAGGTATERKAAVEALIAQVQLTGQGIIPVFRIPTRTRQCPRPTRTRAHNDEEQPPVRTLVRSVGRAGLEPATEGL